MSAISPNKEKFCSLISEIIDKSKDIIVENEDVLEYDAVELTLLLKSIGFRLNSLDFKSPSGGGGLDCDEDDKNIEIEIRCKHSGIKSKLSMKGKKCTCPLRKSVNNNSFWEVQGIAPSTPDARTKGIIQDTSCNLLPDITKRTSNLAKTMLTVLLQHYQTDFEPKSEKVNSVDIKQLVERLEGRVSELMENEKMLDKNQKITETAVEKKTETASNLGSPSKRKPEVNSYCSTPLSTINITPVPLSNENNQNSNDVPKIIVNTTNDKIILNNSPEKSLIENEKPPENCCSDGFTPSPTEIGTTFDKLNPDNERDVCLIEAITDARKQLDSALLMLKCNVTRTSSQNSIITVTPKQSTNFKKPLPSKKPINPNRRLSADSIEINRRHSSGGPAEFKPFIGNGKNSLKASSSSNAINEINKRRSGPHSLDIQMPKQDTPRPRNNFVAKKLPQKNSVTSKVITKPTPLPMAMKSGLVKAQTTNKSAKLPFTTFMKKN